MKSSLFPLFPIYSLVLDLVGLWMFEFLDLVHVQEEVLQELLGLTQFNFECILMLKGLLLLFIFVVLLEAGIR